MAAVFAAALLSMLSTLGPAADNAGPVPAWFDDHLVELAADGDRWVADNTEYRSVNEPEEFYVTQWRRGLGRSLTGRLYAIVDGRETEDYWRYQVYWDPIVGEARVTQFSRGGAVGSGTLVKVDDDFFLDQQFSVPEGARWRTLHRTTFASGVQLSRSYDWQNGSWVPKRSYRWERRAAE